MGREPYGTLTVQYPGTGTTPGSEGKGRESLGSLEAEKPMGALAWQGDVASSPRFLLPPPLVKPRRRERRPGCSPCRGLWKERVDLEVPMEVSSTTSGAQGNPPVSPSFPQQVGSH